MIFSFSGTGNSNYIAQCMADALGNPLLCMNDRIKLGDTTPIETGAQLVIVTPTYAWRIPRIVRDWLQHTKLAGAKQAWFIMTCGSEIGNASKYNRALCQAKGLDYMGTAQIVMPENYIAMFQARRPTKRAISWKSPNRTLTVPLPPFRQARPSPRPAETSTTAS